MDDIDHMAFRVFDGRLRDSASYNLGHCGPTRRLQVNSGTARAVYEIGHEEAVCLLANVERRPTFIWGLYA